MTPTLTPAQSELASKVGHEVAMALAAGRPIEPFTDRLTEFDLPVAQAALGVLGRLRGGRRLGRKIGFSNRALWRRYGVDRPIWGDVLGATAENLNGCETDPGPAISLSGLVEPRIEPEIALGLSSAPSPEMDETALAGCVAWAAPVFEIVQSIYPGWRFRTADAVVANALHGRLLIGPRLKLTRDALLALSETSVELRCDGAQIETGSGANVLGGPLSALRALVEALDGGPGAEPLRAGDLVSTGTLTDARPVAPGQTWTARFSDEVPGVTVRFAA